MPRDAATSDFHAGMAHFLRSGDPAALLEHLADPSAARRLAVYRNNVVRGAIEALRAAYPAVDRLVGPDFFSEMARAYWQASPPVTRSLTLYGDRFAAHVARWRPAEGMAHLPDVARHDRAWLEAHHAPDIAPLSPASIATRPPESLPGLRPGLHPSLRRLAAARPVYAIWCAHRPGSPPETAPAPRDAARHSVIWRQSGTVRHAPLTAADAAFLACLAAGETLETAAARAAGTDPAFDAPALFGRGLAAGWFTGDPA